jgi:hypothetical protein
LDDFGLGTHFIEADTFLSFLSIHPDILCLLHCIDLQAMDLQSMKQIALSSQPIFRN